MLFVQKIFLFPSNKNKFKR